MTTPMTISKAYRKLTSKPPGSRIEFHDKNGHNAMWKDNDGKIMYESRGGPHGHIGPCLADDLNERISD